MLDIGFGELLLLIVVGLLVVRPQHLPTAVAQLLRGIHRLRRMADNLYREIEKISRSPENEELRQHIDELEQLARQAPDKISIPVPASKEPIADKEPLSPSGGRHD